MPMAYKLHWQDAHWSPETSGSVRVDADPGAGEGCDDGAAGGCCDGAAGVGADG